MYTIAYVLDVSILPVSTILIWHRLRMRRKRIRNLGSTSKITSEQRCSADYIRAFKAFFLSRIHTK
jgi:hypothetical protein